MPPFRHGAEAHSSVGVSHTPPVHPEIMINIDYRKYTVGLVHVLLIGKDFYTIPARQEHVKESPGPSIQIPPFIQRDSSVVLHTASSVSQNKPSDKMKFVEICPL
jgi:hypothetical protein